MACFVPEFRTSLEANMRAALAMAIALACIAAPAAAIQKDPPDDPNWSGHYDGSFSTLGAAGRADCEGEGKAIMKSLGEIRADPGLLTRPPKTGDMVSARYYQSIQDKYGSWQGYRCIEIFFSRGDQPIDRNNRNTWDYHYIYLQGYTPVGIQRPIKSTGKAGARERVIDPVGVWDARNGKGDHYVLTLARDGSAISGTIKDDHGGSSPVTGKLLGGIMQLDYNLPGRAGTSLAVLDGDTFSGPDKITGTGWSGMRLPGPAEPFGTWNVRTSRGAVYVLMLDRAGASLYGTISAPGGAGSPIGGSITGQTMYLTYGLPDGRSGHPIVTLAGDAFSGYDPAPASPFSNMAQMGPEGWSGTRQ
jgi:hypothetical protein